MTRKKPLLIATLLVCLVASIYAAYFLQSLPDKETKLIPSLEYTHEAKFTYTITLKPSELYENRTLLRPGEIPYISLIDLVDISFSYRLLSEPPTLTGANVSYRVYSSLESPDGWKKPTTLIPLTSQNETSLTLSFTINITRVQEVIRAIEGETGTSASTYDLNIVPEIHVEALTGSSRISEDFAPVMTIRFLYREGNRLTFEGLNHERKNAMGEHMVTEIVWVKYARYGSYALFILLVTALAYTVWWTWARREAISPVDRAMRKYRDLIVDSAGLEEKRKERTIVRVKSMENLTKVSEETAKPIIHEKRLRHHVFYVLDADVRYEFTAEEIPKMEGERHACIGRELS